MRQGFLLIDMGFIRQSQEEPEADPSPYPRGELGFPRVKREEEDMVRR